jgi:hypothetical protein
VVLDDGDFSDDESDIEQMYITTPPSFSFFVLGFLFVAKISIVPAK